MSMFFGVGSFNLIEKIFFGEQKFKNAFFTNGQLYAEW
jgi:hypothetical protein